MSIIVMGGGILFSLFGVVLLFASVFERSEIKKSFAITAKIVDCEKKTVRYGRKRPTKSYYPVYEYSFLGEVRRHTSNVGSGDPPALGGEVTLYLSKSGHIYEKQSALTSLIFSIVFLMFGVIFIVIAIKYVQGGVV
ncbi:MAG: hypothetical protein HDT43_13020 [Ruminococcaceae bacterium]|nr:hypothetical protein [Oscillospiraceae bacterium]